MFAAAACIAGSGAAAATGAVGAGAAGGWRLSRHLAIEKPASASSELKSFMIWRKVTLTPNFALDRLADLRQYERIKSQVNEAGSRIGAMKVFSGHFPEEISSIAGLVCSFDRSYLFLRMQRIQAGTS